MRRLDEHPADGLAVLDVCSVSRRTPQDDDLKNDLHVVFQRCVDILFMHGREIAKMDALGRLLVDAADDVLINGFRHERDHRRGGLRRRHERRVERHIGIDLVLALALRPEALAAAAHIPVAQLVDEALQGLRRFRDLVGGEALVDRLDHRVEARENPLVHDGELLVVERMIERIEIVDIGIEHIEGIGIPQRAHELSLPFLHGAVVVTVRQPRCAVLIEVPANRIRTVLPQRIHRIDGIALRL